MNKGGFLYLPIVKRIEQILRHRRVGHLWRTRRKTVVAHIDLQNIVVGTRSRARMPRLSRLPNRPWTRTMGNYCADFVQIALGYLISWQSSFFAPSG
jgi:hypothetical protein